MSLPNLGFGSKTNHDQLGGTTYPRYMVMYAERKQTSDSTPNDEDPIFGFRGATTHTTGTEAKVYMGILNGVLPTPEHNITVSNLSAGVVIETDRITTHPGMVLSPTTTIIAPDTKGSLMYDSGSDELKYYDGTWQVLSTGSGMSVHDLTGTWHSEDATGGAGNFLKADSATTFSWQAHGLVASDVGAYTTAQVDSAIDTDIATHAALSDVHHTQNHALIDTTGHTVAGLTIGHFLKADTATTYSFQTHGLSASDVGAYTTAQTDSAIDTDIATHASNTDAHHPKSHDMDSHSDATLVPGSADQMVFWDYSDTQYELLTAGTGLSIVGNNLNCDISQYTDTDTEAVITAELVDGQSIDNAIDSLILTHEAKPAVHHALVTITADPLTISGQAVTFNYHTDYFSIGSSNDLKVGVDTPALTEVLTWGSGGAEWATPSIAAHILATTGPHTGTLPWSDLNKTGSSLADLATRNHASLSDAPADAHHVAFVLADFTTAFASESLANLTTRNHASLSDAPTSAHHVRYADSEAVSAVQAANPLALSHGLTVVGPSVTIGSLSTSTHTNVLILAGDAVEARLSLYGNSQGTGVFFVGQSSTYGGGMLYQGDATPAHAGSGATDSISFYRTAVGVHYPVFHYMYNSDDVTFQGDVTVANLVTTGDVDGVDVSAHAANTAAHHALVTVTADPLTLSGQAVTFNYDSTHFRIGSSNELLIGKDTPANTEVLTWSSMLGAVWSPSITAAHVLATTGPHTGTLPWSDLNKTGSSLADLATRTHASLSDAPADAHHAQSHTLASHSSKAHSELTNVTIDQHHPQSHSIATHSDTTATGAELETLTNGSNADALHVHSSSSGVTGSGTANKIAKWTNTTVLGNSNITDNGTTVSVSGAFSAGAAGFDVNATGSITDCGSIAMGGALTGVTSIANSTTITSQGKIYNDADNSGVYSGELNAIRMYHSGTHGYLKCGTGVLYLEGATSTVLGGTTQTTDTYVRAPADEAIFLQLATSTKMSISSSGIQLFATLFTNDLSPVNNNVDTVGTSITDKYYEMFASSFNTGDVIFANEFRITEVHHPDWDGDKDAHYHDMYTQSKDDGATPGLEFWNNKGEMIALLDEDGHFHIRGKLHECSNIFK